MVFGLEGILERIDSHHHQVLHSVHLVDLALHLEQERLNLICSLHNFLHGLGDLASHHLLSLVYLEVVNSEMLCKILQGLLHGLLLAIKKLIFIYLFLFASFELNRQSSVPILKLLLEF